MQFFKTTNQTKAIIRKKGTIGSDFKNAESKLPFARMKRGETCIPCFHDIRISHLLLAY